MITLFSKLWLPIDRIHDLLELEPFLVIVGLMVFSFFCYFVFLRDLSKDRLELLRSIMKNLRFHGIMFVCCFGITVIARLTFENEILNSRLYGYFGFVTLIWGAMVFVKTFKLLLLEYLFFSHKRDAVPILLVNLGTIILSFAISTTLLATLFKIQLTNFLATSAVASIVLGLAVQDTLGNLFSGIAMQFDKPFELGDWIEVHGSGGVKWIGQVEEISWRATLLRGLSDELIVIPNKTVSQSLISNFAYRGTPIARSVTVPIQFHGTTADLNRFEAALMAKLHHVEGILQEPAPKFFIIENTGSSFQFRVSYFTKDYVSQFRITSDVQKLMLSLFESKHMDFGSQIVRIKNIV